MRWRDHSGQTAAEYLGTLLLVSTLIAALATTDVGDRIRGGIQELVCKIAGGGCEAGGGGSTSPTIGAALEREIAELSPWASDRGGRYQDLLDEAQAAIDRGDYEEADRIIELLRLYRRLSEGVRGDIVDDLLSGDDAAFAALVEEGTTYQDGGKYNRRYFQLDPAPGEGVLAYDFYIPFEHSLFLKGDDRGESDPLLGDYGMDRSRMMVLIDRETGRGVVVQTETCTVPVTACNEPRPIALDMGDGWENDSEHDATGEGINIDQTNQFEIEADGDSVKITYDALNSITPLGISVDGTVEIIRQDDGSYEKGEDNRDDYPAKPIHHYLPGEEPDEVHDYGDVHPDQVDGALPLDPDIEPCSTGPYIRLPFPCLDFD